MKQYADLGYTGHTFFDIDGAQCHAVWNDDEYALCFRGTEPSEIGDILADLNAMRGAMTHGLVHSGFMGELDKLWQNVTEHHGKHKRQEVLHHRPFSWCGNGNYCNFKIRRVYKSRSLFTFGSLEQALEVL